MRTLRASYVLPLLLPALFAAAAPLPAAEEGVHASVITDEDGDEAILMESEWISMHLLPWRQALINRFVFRPTGNDIVEPTNPKNRFGGGGGILMDCFWEQDWRFQELAYKQYQYKITKNGPDEAQVVFETDIEGWLGSNNSGILSNLLSNLTLRRTVTLKRGQPFFRFNVEFINNDKWAKRPNFWIHNNSRVAPGGKDTVVRPSDRGLAAIGGDQASYAGPQGQMFVENFTHGWSARISRERREGIVYLMDYDYVDTLYNCFPSGAACGTAEWWYDSILVFADRPWKGEVYILPFLGLSRVDHATRYFICAIHPEREGDELSVRYRLTSSYESAAQVTLQTEVVGDLEEGEEGRSRQDLPPVTIDELAIQPNEGRAVGAAPSADPLLFKVTAFVELPDGQVKTFRFQRFYTGDYRNKGNVEMVGGAPLVRFERPVQKPRIPPVPADLAVNRKDFKVFAIHGLGTYRLGLETAFREQIPDGTYTLGYCVGNDKKMNGLTDFPYDYRRLFDHRCLVFSGIQDKEFRRIGASILMPYLERGGGLVMVGGQYAWTYELEKHPINQFYPVRPKRHSLRRGPARLQAPEAPDHPVFRGVDLGELPWLFYYHDVELKPESDARVLMRAGEAPFIIEQKRDGQITIAVTANGFGTAEAFDGKTHLRHWKEWPKLFANLVRYAGQELK
jgi:hypothetical protein